LLAFSSSDAAVYQIFVTLSVGGALFLLDPEEQNDPRRFWAWIAEHRINVINCVPSFLSAMLAAPPERGALEQGDLILGGARLTAALAERARACLAHRRLINLYGPTEITIEATTFMTEDASYEEPIPIGRPSPTYRI